MKYKTLAILAFAATSILITGCSSSNDTVPTQITDWFKALKANDAATIEMLLDDSAIIELKDLGISQNKEEFINSLDQWAELNGGAEIVTRPAAIEENQVEMEVCYRFASNEVFNRETYDLNQGKITKSVQTQISETCEDF